MSLLKRSLKIYFDLTKAGICIFALMSAMAGFAVSYEIGQDLEPLNPLLFLIGFYFVCAGSFALNQASEWRRDAKMDRTKQRPIPSGDLSVYEAALIGSTLLLFGLFLVFLISPLSAMLSLLTVVFYNGVYTYYLKPHWAFAAVPGAIPGAMPVMIGYSANSPHIFAKESIYLFLVLFLWQMPHFWSLAIRYREDYKKGGFPVLPAAKGVPATLFQIGLYLFAYLGVVALSPLFLQSHLVYLLLVLPFGAKLAWEFFRYLKEGERKWLPFFMWVNFSALVFLLAPVVDKWIYLYSILDVR